MRRVCLVVFLNTLERICLPKYTAAHLEMYHRENANVHKYSRAEIANGLPRTPKYSGVRRVGTNYVKTINGKDYQIVFAEDLKDMFLDYWEKLDNPGALRGRDAVFAALKEKYTGISRRDIADILRNMETMQIHAPQVEVKISRPFVARKALSRWCMDTTTIENADGVKLFTLMVVIDTFSKFIWARIVSTNGQKYTGKKVADELKKIFAEETPNLPAVCLSDNGTDFKTKEMAKLLESKGIKQMFIPTYSPQLNSFVERANKTLKMIIHRYLTHYNGIIITDENMQKIVANYNQTVHGTTKKRPVDIHPGKGEMRREDVTSAHLEMKTRAAILVDESLSRFPRLRIGDFVRVSKKISGEFRKGTKLKKKSYMAQYYWELYKVAHISRPVQGKAPQFTLFDMESGHDIERKFIRQHLLKVDKKNLIREMPEGHYSPEKILGKKTVGGKPKYLIRWSGYGPEYDTWEFAQSSYRTMIDLYNSQN